MATIKKACKGAIYPKSSSVSKRLGSPSKAKNGKSFPDLNKDGKITKADILKGRGVIAKKGMKVKKAQAGIMQSQAPVRKGASRKPILGLRKAVVNEGINNADVMDPKFDPMKMQKLRASATKKSYYKTGGSVKKTMKTGGKMTKKCKYGCK